MSYLDKTVLEMKEKIMLIYEYLNNAKTEEEVTRQTKKLEELLKEKLIESFKNGIEIGKERKVSRAERVRKKGS